MWLWPLNHKRANIPRSKHTVMHYIGMWRHVQWGAVADLGCYCTFSPLTKKSGDRYCVAAVSTWSSCFLKIKPQTQFNSNHMYHCCFWFCKFTSSSHHVSTNKYALLFLSRHLTHNIICLSLWLNAMNYLTWYFLLHQVLLHQVYINMMEMKCIFQESSQHHNKKYIILATSTCASTSSQFKSDWDRSLGLLSLYKLVIALSCTRNIFSSM
jgi:hypothetical protein